MVSLWASHGTALTGRAGWLEGPLCPQLHGFWQASGPSPPHGHSSSARLDWLPNGDLRAAAPEMRGDLQGLIRPELQTSQSTTCPCSFRKSEKQACPGSRAGGGWRVVVGMAVVFAGQRLEGRASQHVWTQRLNNLYRPCRLSRVHEQPQSPGSSNDQGALGFQLDFLWIQHVSSSTHHLPLFFLLSKHWLRAGLALLQGDSGGLALGEDEANATSLHHCVPVLASTLDQHSANNS